MLSKLKEKISKMPSVIKKKDSSQNDPEPTPKEEKKEVKEAKEETPSPLKKSSKTLPTSIPFLKNPVFDIPTQPYLDSLKDEDIQGFSLLYARLLTENLNRQRTEEVLKLFAGKIKEEFPDACAYLSGNDFVMFSELKEDPLEDKRKRLYQYIAYLKESKEINVDIVVSTYDIMRGSLSDALSHAEDLLYNTENPVRKEKKRIQKQFAGLTKQQQELKEKITKSHIQPDPADIKDSIEKLKKEFNDNSNAEQILAVFIIDKTCNNLFIFTDIENFFDIFSEQEYNFDFTYIYILRNNSFVPIGLDTFYEEITDMLKPIGDMIKNRNITSLSDIEQIKDVGFFEQVGIDINFSSDD